MKYSAIVAMIVFCAGCKRESKEEQTNRIVGEALERYKPRFEAVQREKAQSASEERLMKQILENQNRSLEYQRRNDEVNRMRVQDRAEGLMQDIIAR